MNRKPSFSAAWSCGAGPVSACGNAARGVAAAPKASSCAISLSSRITIQRPSMIAPVHAVITPARISVLPKLNSLTGIPKAIPSKPASKKPIPAIKSAINI